MLRLGNFLFEDKFTFDVDGSRLGLVEISVVSFLFKTEEIARIHSLIENFISLALSISLVISSSFYLFIEGF